VAHGHGVNPFPLSTARNCWRLEPVHAPAGLTAGEIKLAGAG